MMTFSVAGSFLFLAGLLVMGDAIAHEDWGKVNLQGRYLFPCLSLHMLILTAGLLPFGKPGGGRRRMAWILVGSLLLWHLSSLALVLERFYL